LLGIGADDLSNKALPTCTYQNGRSKVAQSIEMTKKLQVLLGSLAKSDSRIDQDLPSRDSPRFCSLDQTGQFRCHFFDDVLELDVGLHRV